MSPAPAWGECGLSPSPQLSSTHIKPIPIFPAHQPPSTPIFPFTPSSYPPTSQPLHPSPHPQPAAARGSGPPGGPSSPGRHGELPAGNRTRLYDPACCLLAPSTAGSVARRYASPRPCGAGAGCAPALRTSPGGPLAPTLACPGAGGGRGGAVWPPASHRSGRWDGRAPRTTHTPRLGVRKLDPRMNFLYPYSPGDLPPRVEGRCCIPASYSQPLF